MGLGYPPDWGEHTASIRPGDETVLEENMTFHRSRGCGSTISASSSARRSG